MCPQPPLDILINPCITSALVGVYLMGPIGILVSIFLIFIILRVPKKKKFHYLLALFILINCFGLSATSLFICLFINSPLILTICQIAIVIVELTFPVFYWFVRSFLKIRKEKWILYLSIAFPFLFLVLSIFNPEYLMKGVEWDPILGYYEYIFNLGTKWILYPGFLFGVWGSWKLLQAFRKSSSAIVRNRLKYISMAPFLIFAGGIFVSFPATHIFPFDQLGSVAAAAVLTYSILRYRLFNITLIFKRGLFYSILTASVTGVYLSLSFLFQSIFHRPEAPVSSPALISTILFISLVFQPLQRATQLLLDKVFFRKKYDAQELIANLSQSFSQTLDLDALSSSLIKILSETLQIGKAALFLVNEKTKRLEVQKTRKLSKKVKDLTIDISSPLVKLLSKSDEVQLKETLKERGVPLKDIGRYGLELFIPLRSQEKLRGILVLGPKLSQEPYSMEELDFLETFLLF